MTWTCFMAMPLSLGEQTLRRYTQSESEEHLHDAGVRIEDSPLALDANGRGGDNWPHDDPRWPAACACGYVFQEGDAWQHTIRCLYTGAPDGLPFTLWHAPIGAMWETPWLIEGLERPSDDDLQPGRYKGYISRLYWRDWYGKRAPIGVKTPGGDWIIDSRSTNGEGWEITGDAPVLTARPSIDIPGRYHGWLTNGELSDPI